MTNGGSKTSFLKRRKRDSVNTISQIDLAIKLAFDPVRWIKKRLDKEKETISRDEVLPAIKRECLNKLSDERKYPYIFIVRTYRYLIGCEKCSESIKNETYVLIKNNEYVRKHIAQTNGLYLGMIEFKRSKKIIKIEINYRDLHYYIKHASREEQKREIKRWNEFLKLVYT